MKKTNSQKGITLIALIITIVVLLILAVVAIRAVQGDGIIAKAKQARDEYQVKTDEEQAMLDNYIAQIENSSSGKQSSIASTTEEGVPIPVGFKYVTGTKDTGVVIENETEGSQFVWVPVTTDIVAYGLGKSGAREPDVVTGVEPSDTVDSASGEEYDAVEANLTLAGCTVDLNNDNVVNAYDFKIQLTNEFDLMAASVNKYDGFYVGRYEVSFNSENSAQSKGSSTGGTEVKPATAATDSANTWYGLYALCKTYNTSSVASSMIWGSQYDAMMTWMKDTGTDVDSSIYGCNTTGYTGSVETDKINNVYDLYSNYQEWTQEAYNDGSFCVRNGRGGDISVGVWIGYPSLDDWACEPTDDYEVRSSRLALYIV